MGIFELKTKFRQIESFYRLWGYKIGSSNLSCLAKMTPPQLNALEKNITENYKFIIGAKKPTKTNLIKLSLMRKYEPISLKEISSSVNSREL